MHLGPTLRDSASTRPQPAAAFEALAAFRAALPVPAGKIAPVLINDGRLVEVQADGPLVRVLVYASSAVLERLDVDAAAVVAAVDLGRRRYPYVVDDLTSGRPRQLRRRLDIRPGQHLGGPALVAYAAEMAAGRWRPLAGTTRGGVTLVAAEWAEVVRFARLWRACLPAPEGRQPRRDHPVGPGRLDAARREAEHLLGRPEILEGPGRSLGEEPGPWGDGPEED